MATLTTQAITEGAATLFQATFAIGDLLIKADIRLRDITDRLWDQLTIFRQHYHHYGFARSNSLKSVLPVIAPALSYQALDVQNGGQAQVVWEAMIGEGDTAVKQQLADQLRAYCHLDTLAMVAIHRFLSR